jgi:hypothetical protein
MTDDPADEELSAFGAGRSLTVHVEQTDRLFSSPATGQSMRFQPLLQQFNQHCSRLSLSLGGDLSNERLNCTFDQNAQDYERVHADRAGHADRLSEDMRWVGSVGGDALNSAYEGLDGGKRTVWHLVRMAAPVAVTQDARQMFLICSLD